MILGAVTLFLLAVYFDVRERRIPNTLLAAFLCISPVLVFWHYGLDWVPLLRHLLAALLVFGVGFVFWLVGWMGAGDVKLLGVAGVYFPFQQAGILLLNIALAGLLLAIVVWPLVKIVSGVWGKSSEPERRLQDVGVKAMDRDDIAPRGKKGLPYAVAIAAGGIATLMGVSPLPT